MAFDTYNDQHKAKSEVYDNAYKRVKGLWTLARREFGIRATYEFTFGAFNPETMAKLPHPHSHVLVRKDGLTPLILMRVSKSEMEQPDLAETVLPREMAHIVCKIMPALGDPYHRDEAWQKVYKKLGGKC